MSGAESMFFTQPDGLPGAPSLETMGTMPLVRGRADCLGPT